MSQREYARSRGLSHTAVQKAIRLGRINTYGGGKINPTEADRAWAENTDLDKPSNRVTGDPAGARGRGQAKPRTLKDFDGDSENSVSYAKARAAREIYQAQLAKLELEQKRGELVDAEQVKADAFAMARKARDQLLSLPDRVIPRLVAAKTPKRMRPILEAEILLICEEIASDDDES